MSELVEMTHEEWREWFKSTVGRYPTILDTHQMKLETGDPDIHAFQGIVTKLRTTKGSPYALDVMAEAADEIELLHEALDLIRIIDDGWLLQTPPTHTQAREQMNEILSRIKALRERGAKVSA